ncbi:MAG: four helix bundle protein [bacterium]|nr:four helix bundle protein [bacterium]
MRDFRELKVWEKSHRLVLAVYRVTAGFPREELYGLTSQMRRSAASVPANIAEGCCRRGDVEFARFLQIAMASASELDYHCLLAHDLGFLTVEGHIRLAEMVTEVKRMLATLIGKLRR